MWIQFNAYEMEITSLSKWYRRENGRGKNAFYKISHITSHDAYNQKRGVCVYVWIFHHHDNAISFYVAVWKSFSPLFFTFDCHFLKEFNLMKKKNQLNFQRQALTKLISSATLFRGNSLNLKQQWISRVVWAS